VLRQGFGFLGEMTAVAAGAERTELLARCRELLQFVFSMIPEVPKEDVDVDVEGMLNEFDYWVFNLTANVMLSGISLAEARELWQPILELPVAAHDWVRAFFEAWFRVGLAGDTKNFEAIWSGMVEHMLDSQTWSPEWKYGWYHVHDVVAELMGIRSARTSLGQAKYVPLVAAAAPFYERWAERWIKEGDLATSFEYFLSVRSDPEFWKAFLTVLNALCARQDAVALAIQTEASRSSAEVGAKT
jgi:hypothetical protein